jgi:hypothetical protein
MRAIRRRILFAVAGLIYGWSLLFASLVACAGGDGANGPIMTLFSPISLTIEPLHNRFGVIADNILTPSMPFLWMLSGGLLGIASNRKCRWALIILLLIHYISAVACVMLINVGWRPVTGAEMVEVMIAMWITIAIYITGQIAIWWILIYKNDGTTGSDRNKKNVSNRIAPKTLIK